MAADSTPVIQQADTELDYVVDEAPVEELTLRSEAPVSETPRAVPTMALSFDPISTGLLGRAGGVAPQPRLLPPG